MDDTQDGKDIGTVTKIKDETKKKRYDDTKGDTIFLRNVSKFDTDESSLTDAMEENFGETEYCLICRDRETGASKGSAFVKFKDPATAAKCLEEFKNHELQYKFFLDGRNLFVLPALSRDEAEEINKSNSKSIKLEEKPKKKKKARHLPREKFFPSKKPVRSGQDSQVSSKNPDEVRDKKGKKSKSKKEGMKKKSGGGAKGKKIGGGDKKRWRHEGKKKAKSS